MKQASYEDEFSFGVCPILEDIDLDAMTDEQLQEELSNWQQQSGGDGPLDYVVEDNIRLVERHIELRGMSDEDLARDLDQAEWAVGYWTEKFAEDNCPRTRNTIAHRKRQAEDYRRELARRADPEEQEAADQAEFDEPAPAAAVDKAQIERELEAIDRRLEELSEWEERFFKRWQNENFEIPADCPAFPELERMRATVSRLTRRWHSLNELA
ncbi:MAG: hypothetical protein KDD97_10625 [Rhodobacteraceae bacterium]|jgi:DNA repair exonuclease SbcCD ATPase subunit|nr:hypothetical protein [uncultured Defluviimonas sp.]MCB2126032.1 hypothetical protein [Paracoccaceae bacterium]